MHRRECLSVLGLSLLLGGIRGVSANRRESALPTSSGAPRLVLVELAGANDGLNTLVPRHNDHYRRARPRLAIADDRLLVLNDTLGLHPALRPLMAAVEAGDLAMVQGLGYPQANRSHFRSVALWERAGDGRSEPAANGWLTHAVEHGLHGRASDVDGMSLAGSLSLFASGSGRWLSAESVSQLLIEDTRDTTVVSSGNTHVERMAARFAALDETLDKLRGKLQAAPQVQRFDGGGALGEQLRQVTRFIAATIDVPVYRVRLDGFDTHERQAPRHARQLTLLAEALASFREALLAMGEWDNTVVMTYSEFGRRLLENASGGTDHGTAAPHLVMGGRVNGALYGSPPELAAASLVEGDPVHTMDYRALYERVLDGALGARDAHLDAFADRRLRGLFTGA